MKKLLIIIGVAVAIGIITWSQLHERAAAPQETNLPDESGGELLIAESDAPAAGVCAEASDEQFVLVEVNRDVPSPRCQKLTAKSRLQIRNNTDVRLTLWFGKDKSYSFIIEPKETYVLPGEIGSLLLPGVHKLAGAPFQGPEIWVVSDEREEMSSGPYNPGSGIGGGQVCIQVITPARNPKTGEVRDFPTPCDVPAGWEGLGDKVK